MTDERALLPVLSEMFSVMEESFREIGMDDLADEFAGASQATARVVVTSRAAAEKAQRIAGHVGKLKKQASAVKSAARRVVDKIPRGVQPRAHLRKQAPQR